MKALIWIAILACIGGVGYYAYNNKRKGNINLSRFMGSLGNVPVEHCGILKMSDVTAYYKNLSLMQGIYIPFMAQDESFRDIVKDIPADKPCVLLGVYNNQTDNVEHAKLIVADQIDQSVKDVLGNEKLVTLS